MWIFVFRGPLFILLCKEIDIFLYIRIFWDPALFSALSTVSFADVSYNHSILHECLLFIFATMKAELKAY